MSSRRRLDTLGDLHLRLEERPAASNDERRCAQRRAGARDRRALPRPQRVLVVDDSADVRDVWRQWLALWRFEVAEAENGMVAVQKAREWRPALIVMDLTMPVLDGVSATLLLKDDPAPLTSPYRP